MLLKQFNLASISILSKLKQGSMEFNKCVKILKESGNISEGLILMFDEMLYQKCYFKISEEEQINGVKNLLGPPKNSSL